MGNTQSLEENFLASYPTSQFEIERITLGESEKSAFECARNELIILISGLWKGKSKEKKARK